MLRVLRVQDRKTTLRLQAATGEIRTAKFAERDHLVVPVVALMEGIIWPVNSETPEFVPAEVLGNHFAGWNGRVCVQDHPSIQGAYVSANSPRVLEKHAFGTVFNTSFDGKHLKMEAWLDPIKATACGAEAVSVMERLRAGKAVEVSVGTFVTLEEAEGEYNGQKYSARWAAITPDHLAFLPAGVKGACSNEMGCGAPRVARVHAAKEDGTGYDVYHVHEEPRVAEVSATFLQRLTKLLVGSMSDMDLRRELNKMLATEEPGFMGVEYVYPREKSVIYGIMLPDAPYLLYRRSYTQSGDTVTLSGDRREVEPVTTFEDVKASRACGCEVSAACGCGGSGKPTATSHEETKTMTKTERVKALMQKLKIKETPAILAAYEGMTEEQITALEAQEVEQPATPPAAPPAPVAPVAQPTAAAAQPIQPSFEESATAYFGVDAATVKRVLAQHQEAEARKRTSLLTMLAAQKVYTREQLEAMDVDNLEKLVALAGLNKPTVAGADYSLMPGGQPQSQETTAPAPTGLRARFAPKPEQAASH